MNDDVDPDTIVKPIRLPVSQAAMPKRAMALASLFEKAEPEIYNFIQTLGGHPRIFEYAAGYDDHVSFIVDHGWGEKCKRSIVAWLNDKRPEDSPYPQSHTFIDVLMGDHGDVIVWRA